MVPSDVLMAETGCPISLICAWPGKAASWEANAFDPDPPALLAPDEGKEVIEGGYAPLLAEPDPPAGDVAVAPALRAFLKGSRAASTARDAPDDDVDAPLPLLVPRPLS